MPKETAAFFSLLRPGLWGDGNPDIRIVGTTDWYEVYQLAAEQSVLGLVLAGLEHSDVKPPQVLLLQWIGEVQVIEQQNKAMNEFVALLIEKLREVDIYALLVKGQGVAQCYERPLWRTSGDVDLLLSKDNYEKAKVFLIPYASEVETEYEREKAIGLTIRDTFGTSDQGRADEWSVELHGHLYVGLSSRVERELDMVLQDTFSGGQVRTWMNGTTQVYLLKAENDVFYVFAHILQHFYKGGIGLRQICDWCRLLYCYRVELDLRILELRIKRAGLMSEWKAFGAFAVEYLGMPIEAMPFLNDNLNANLKKKADRICEFILEVGNFGHNRDMSYYDKYPYLVRKAISAWWRAKDLCRHAMIFPLDSLKFSFAIMVNGLRSAVRGE